jgi:hypothetical protein
MLRQGDEVVFPLLDGRSATGHVNLAIEDSGWVRIGGGLEAPSKGSFSLAVKEGQTIGGILLPDEGKAYVIEAGEPGRFIMTEKPLGEVICVPPSQVAMRAFARAGVGASGSGMGTAEAPPVLSSRPAAMAVLYLDFDGETVTDPSWNSGNTIVAQPANLSTAQMTEVWKRVSEDYSPFDIDVTTSLSRYTGAPVGRRMRCIITETNWTRPASPSSPGGVAAINSFSLSGTGYHETVPAWVFSGGWGSLEVAETAAHELGHTLGLQHHGTVGASPPWDEYYPGHGSGAVNWAPIMGHGTYSSIVQWCKGEYANANRPMQDDVARIARAENGFGFVFDEAGGTTIGAPPLAMTSGAFTQPGVVSQETDADVYALPVPYGANLTVQAAPAEISPNVDIVLTLLDSSGAVLASSNPDLSLEASLTQVVSPGQYFLKVQGTGRANPLTDGYSSYGSIGQYVLSGTLVVPAPTVTAITPASGGTAGGTSVTITGANFISASDVTIGGTAAAGFTVVNATTITAITPAGAAGAADVVVTTPGGMATAPGIFFYISPEAELASLALSTGDLSPTFSPATNAYSAIVPYSTTSVTVTAVKAHAGASLHVRVNGGSYGSVVSGNPSGALALHAGMNLVEVRVTTGDGSASSTYGISVMRQPYTATSQPAVASLPWPYPHPGWPANTSSQAVVDGFPAIVFMDGPFHDKDLKYVRALDATGSTWGTPVTIAGGSGNQGEACCLLVVDGLPAVCYLDRATAPQIMGLKFIRALDAAGTAWGMPAIAAFDEVTATSMAMVDGVPAIGYVNRTDGAVRFTRAMSSDGGMWPGYSNVSTGGGPPAVDRAYVSLTVVNGNPALAYAYHGDLHFSRASNSTGDIMGWGTPQNLGESMVTCVSLMMAGGRPVISLIDGTGRLCFRRGEDADGSAWGAAAILDDSHTCNYAAMALVSGRPAISYHHQDGAEDLVLIRAKDSGGTEWEVPFTVDAAGVTGIFPTLADLGGQPSISYYTRDALDPSLATLRYARVISHPMPEMQVKGNNVIIADGDSTPSMSDFTDYGSRSVSGGSVVRSYTIENIGPDFLFFTGEPFVTLSGPHASDFTVTMQPNYAVPAGYSSAFLITFDPSAAGLRTAVVSIPSSDGDENPYNFSIHGTGIPGSPEISVKGNSTLIVDGDSTPAGGDHTHFGGVEAASGSLTRTFTIENTGTDTLTLTGSPLVAVSGAHAADFTITSVPAASVAVGGSTTFQICFDPSATGTRSAVLSIINNDTDENPFNFSIEGTGYTTTEGAAAAWAAAFPGISGPAAGPLATPFDDGVPNLLKYAFNMPLTGPNVAPLIPGTSSSGLPAMGVVNTSGTPTSVRIEFIRRKNSTLIYTPQFGSALNNFVPTTATPVVTFDDGTWERMVVDQPLAPGQTAAFCRVVVSAP